MFIYWAMFLILASGALLSQEETSNRSRLMFVLFASVPTALMIGLRWEVGTDWKPYLEIFDYTKLFSFDQAIGHPDPGFIVLNWLLHQIGAKFWVLNMICGIVFVAGLTAFCRMQPNPWLAYLVAFPYLVIVIGMSGDRQSLAMGFFFLALNAFAQRKLTHFTLLTIVAAVFHGSVLLMLPICLLSYTRSGLQKTLLLLVAGALGFYFFQDIFNVYASRYSTEKLQSTGVAYRLAMNSMSAIVFLLFEKRFGLEEHQAKLWRNISFCTFALVLLLLVFPSSTAIDRFLLYLFPLQFVVLSRAPGVLTANRKGAGQLTGLVIAYAALVQVTFLVFGSYASSYIPYRSIFYG